MDLTELPAGPSPPRVLYAVIEIPKGGKNKYEYDRQLGLFRLDRVLYSSVHYPAAYGFIPGTAARDGDPMDILVMTTEPTFTGCLIEVRPIGLFHMRDEAGEDEKVLSVPVADPGLSHVRELDDIAPHFLKEVEHFFKIYKDLEGKKVVTVGWEGREAAEEAVRTALAAYRNVPS